MEMDNIFLRRVWGMLSFHSMHISGVPTASWPGEGGLGWSVGKTQWEGGAKEAIGRAKRKVGEG